VSARVAGKPQVSADIVRLFVEPTQYEYPQEEQKSIQSSPPDYTIDYAALDYNQDESKMDDYDAFDYVNGDFDKVRNGGARADGSSKKKRPQQSKQDRGGPTSTPSNTETTVETLHRIEEDDGFIRETQIFGKFGTVRIDKIPGQTSREETSTAPVPTVPSVSSERPAQPIFHPEDQMLEDHTVKSKINPSELDFLALISSSRVKDRPFNIKNNTDEFGSRQPGSAGSGFQFGNVQIVGEDDQDDRTRLAVPRAIEGNNQDKENSSRNKASDNRRTAEERRKQLAEEERERMERIRKQREEVEKRRIEEIKQKEKAEKHRLAEIERKKKEEKEDEDLRRKERIEKLKKEREEQLKREQQERDKKEREKQLREQREKRRREEREKRLKEERERKRKAEMEERERKRKEEIEQKQREGEGKKT